MNNIAGQNASSIIAFAKGQGRNSLLENEAKAICVEYGIPVPNYKVAVNGAQAVKFASEIGYPVVLKIVSPDIIHKSEAGGVIVNLTTEAEVEKAYEQILENAKNYNPISKIVGVLVMEMAPKSTEVIIGCVKDSQFGQTVMFGLGGVFVEIFKDVSFRVAPITKEDAREMITEVKSYPLLKGYRNTPLADTDALADILLKTSKLAIEHPEIKEIDLNPVIVYSKGAKAVDSRIILQ